MSDIVISIISCACCIFACIILWILFKNWIGRLIGCIPGVDEIDGLGEWIDSLRVSPGGECNKACDCSGYTSLAKPGSYGCCPDENGKKTCTMLRRDWAGVGYCPLSCMNAPLPLGQKGKCCKCNRDIFDTSWTGNSKECTVEGGGITCENGEYPWKRQEGQPCDTHLACSGGSLTGTPNGLGCCNGVCTKLKKDWAGTWWCPDVCKSGMFASAGSC